MNGLASYRSLRTSLLWKSGTPHWANLWQICWNSSPDSLKWIHLNLGLDGTIQKKVNPCCYVYCWRGCDGGIRNSVHTYTPAISTATLCAQLASSFKTTLCF